MFDQKSWCNPTELSKQKERICARLKRNEKLFIFLRQNRHLIFTEEVHQKLLSMKWLKPKVEKYGIID